MSCILSLTEEAIRRVENRNTCAEHCRLRKKNFFALNIDNETLLLLIVALFLLNSGADTMLLAALIYVIL